jgi:hypothetical protein
MIPTDLIIAIVFAHWVGDFVLQNNSMAINKSHSIYWLSIHVAAYITGVAAVLFLSLGFFSIKWLAVNAMLHWIVDFITSKINSRLNKLEDKHWFFTAIGFDQMLHYVCLFATTKAFL